MSKIIKAQNGLSFAIPIIRTLSQVFPRISVLPGMFRSPKEVVGEKELNNAFRTYALKKTQELGKKSVERFTVPTTTSAEQSDVTRVYRPVVVPTRKDIDLHLGEHRTATKAMPVSRIRIKVASAPADTTQAKAGSTEAQRDDTGTATGNTASQNTRNTSQRRLTAKERLTGKLNETSNTNSTTPNSDNNPGFFRRNKKTLIGIGGIVGAPYIFKTGQKGINAWIDAWGFGGDEDKDKLRNTDLIQKQAPVQNDTTQAYNGFLINQQNLVE